MPPTVQEWASGLSDGALAGYLRNLKIGAYETDIWTLTEQEALIREAANRVEKLERTRIALYEATGFSEA